MYSDPEPFVLPVGEYVDVSGEYLGDIEYADELGLHVDGELGE